MKDRAFTQTDLLIAEVTDVNRKRNMVEIFDELSDTLCKVADLAEFIRIAHPNIEFVEAAEDASISLSGVVEKYAIGIYSFVNNYNWLINVIYIISLTDLILTVTYIMHYSML